jgi:hypothetical protein
MAPPLEDGVVRISTVPSILYRANARVNGSADRTIKVRLSVWGNREGSEQLKGQFLRYPGALQVIDKRSIFIFGGETRSGSYRAKIP